MMRLRSAMPCIRRWFLAALIVPLWMMAPPLPSASAGEFISDTDTKHAKAAFKAVKAAKWKTVSHIARRIQDPDLVNILKWIDYTRPGTKASFETLAAFIRNHPHWPRQYRLRQRAEEAMTHKLSTETLLAWFKDYPPVSTPGWTRFISALIASGDTETARDLIRMTWIEKNFTRRQEKTFYRRYRKFLTRVNHQQRLDRLLWEGSNWSARRMFWRVDKQTRALAQARWMLRHRRGNVDRAITKVPDELKNHPSLVYERLRWRRKKGRYDDAMELLEPNPGDPLHPELWWTERAFLARKALQKGHVSKAFNIASQHKLSEGADYADAEWMSGWIALRFLGDPKLALPSFERMYHAVKYPISRARGAYWAGRAAEALQNPAQASFWYGIASTYPTTYYGQLAAARYNPEHGLVLPPEPDFTEAEKQAFMAHPFVRLARILYDLGEKARLRPFLMALSDVQKTPSWYYLSSFLARTLNRPDLAVRIAKKADREGFGYFRNGYPLLKSEKSMEALNGKGAEAPLVLSVIRQESAFHVSAESHAGARGLMQLMPQTAKRVASQMKVRYSKKRLSKDSAYNLKLGQKYLGDMLKEFKGSYILALAAYNAGPSRSRKWIRDSGDPRDPDVNAVDWVEMIPFNETRNYVQRVLENLQIYRRRLDPTEVAETLENDLQRTTDDN